MNALIESGIRHFDRREYFEAHEAFEDLWRVATGETRLVYQGLVQVSAGLLKSAEGRHEPALRLLRRGLDKLDAVSDHAAPWLDRPLLLARLRRIEESIEAGVRFEPPRMPRAGRAGSW